jgi:hypothetical protein
LSVHTTETASVRRTKALLVFFACAIGYGACAIGYGACAIEQTSFGDPWPTTVRVDVAGYRSLNKSPPPPVMTAEKATQPKRVERLL